MSKEKEMVPKLRFPEFKSDGNWDKKSIEDLCDILNNLRKPLAGTEREKGDYPYYGASGIIDYVKEFIFNERLLLVGEDGAKWSSYEKTAFMVEGKFWVNNHAHVLKPIIVNGKFLENYLVKLDISTYITGAAPPKLTLGKLKSIPVPVPKNSKEQKKIADCLSSLDDLITAENQKLEALKAHKKGLMQQLFPAEGKKVPKLRFKEFKNSNEWIEKSLESIGEFTGGGTPSKGNDSYWRGDIPWVSSSDISEDSIHEIKITRFITKEALENSATKKVPKNSILLVSRVGVGKLAISSQSVCTSQDFTNFTPNKDNLEFLAYYLKLLTNKLLELSQGMAIKGFTKDDISKLKLFLPKSPTEQQKIADSLSSLDKLINKQSEKVKVLRIHKKGMMQQLFPDLN